MTSAVLSAEHNFHLQRISMKLLTFAGNTHALQSLIIARYNDVELEVRTHRAPSPRQCLHREASAHQRARRTHRCRPLRWVRTTRPQLSWPRARWERSRFWRRQTDPSARRLQLRGACMSLGGCAWSARARCDGMPRRQCAALTLAHLHTQVRGTHARGHQHVREQFLRGRPGRSVDRVCEERARLAGGHVDLPDLGLHQVQRRQRGQGAHAHPPLPICDLGHGPLPGGGTTGVAPMMIDPVAIYIQVQR